MTPFLSIGAVLSVLIVYSSVCAQLTTNAVRDTPQAATAPAKQRAGDEWRIDDSKVLLAGTFNRETKAVQISKGLSEPRKFENFDSAFVVLGQAGYEQEGLRKLRSIVTNEKDADDKDRSSQTTAKHRFDSSDVLGTFQTTNTVVEFTLYNFDISGYSDPAKVSAVTDNNKPHTGCEQISKSCIRCPNGKVYCVIKNLKRMRASSS